MKVVIFWQRIILGSFYVFFLFLPLIFTGDTSELFELNKMWFTYAIAIIIGFAWIGKMIFQKQVRIQRTPLDIPIFLFFLSQLIATIFSLDSYVSFWGYYSRFNGGLLSTITYIFLYYALVSNVNRKHVIRFLQTSLVAGLIAALWALPSHFGYDPTCYVFRGNFDVSCWTDAFQPKVRIFGTLGQPDWLAAHLAILIPIAMAFGIHALMKLQRQYQVFSIKYVVSKKEGFVFLYYLILTALFYIDLLYTRARSGFVAIWVALVFLFAAILWQRRSSLKFPLILYTIYFILFFVVTFFIGSSISQIDKFDHDGLKSLFAKHTSVATTQQQSKPPTAFNTGEIGGTDSGTIRLLVWRGALDAWLHYPLFGTGVETFAFAYYQFRPAAHNMTSEWDYLYNKAHNEYLNYLATTGIFGLGTYLLIIGCFFFLVFKNFKCQMSNFAPSPKLRSVGDKFQIKNQNTSEKELRKQQTYNLLVLGLISGYISILVSNFFGFSVVSVNVYLFLIPGFVFVLEDMLSPTYAVLFPKKINTDTADFSPWQYLCTCIAFSLACYFIITLFVFWQADKSYAYGMNLDHAGYYQNATSYLQQAVQMRPNEPTFKDELASNEGVLAGALVKTDKATAQKYAQDAIALTTDVTQHHPNDIVYWKTQVRVYYSLSQINPQYLSYALTAIEKAHQLAPTDAKISYNLGLLYGQTGQYTQAITTLQNTIKLKPDYRDAYYALGLMYHQAAIDTKNKVVNPDLQQKAVAEMQFILTNFNKSDPQATEALKTWGNL